MPTHKINLHSKEHQDFLAQNRKDPITGDTILAGDEVVFCAGCKSVFLKDTWEYLRGQHCEQNETLIEFPLSANSIQLQKSEKLLFYSYLTSKDNSFSNIPNIDRDTWKYRGTPQPQNTISFSIYVVALISVFVGITGAMVYNNPLFVLALVIFLAVLFVIKHFYASVNAHEINTFHNNFNSEVFYISNKSIGFSTKYGVEDYTSSFADIASLSFDFSQFSSFSSKIGNCTITNTGGRKVKFYINYFEMTENDSFLKTLHFLNQEYNISIDITTNSRKNRDEAERFISRNDSKINFSFVE
ncbi:hypothetical protein [Bernardetia sp.]|uniref:hypothetical protein n=1 Tax=Bernardetia sp. TaxID=1937974 RepID=UPI0025BC6ED8|nr:hypothetical protein [Bernardetia sp.]